MDELDDGFCGTHRDLFAVHAMFRSARLSNRSIILGFSRVNQNMRNSIIREDASTWCDVSVNLKPNGTAMRSTNIRKLTKHEHIENLSASHPPSRLQPLEDALQ